VKILLIESNNLIKLLSIYFSGYSYLDSPVKLEAGLKPEIARVDNRDGDFRWGRGGRRKRDEENRREREREVPEIRREKRVQKHLAKSSASDLANPSDENWEEEDDLKVEEERMRREKLIRKNLEKSKNGSEKSDESSSSSFQRDARSVKSENVELGAKQAQSDSSSSLISKEQNHEEKRGEEAKRKRHRKRGNEKTREDQSNSCDTKNKNVSKEFKEKEFKQRNRKKNRSSERKNEAESDKKGNTFKNLKNFSIYFQILILKRIISNITSGF